MIFYSDKNVHEAGLDRIRYIFDEFYPHRKVVVSFSGGKDSTALLHLVKEVMDERGIEKIPVFFLDQEVEAPQTIEYVREVMSRPWVEPYWVQTYFQEWNASSGTWFNVWGPGEKWIREKEPGNPYTDLKISKTCHFKEVLNAVNSHLFGEDYVCLGGVRIEESPARRLGLTVDVCYKDITWGKVPAHNALVLYPIWDWRTNDVWYYIFSNRLPYCKLYNYYMTHKRICDCRVSSFIHENSIKGLAEIKEISPEFYAKALNRVANINTTVQTLNSFWNYVLGDLPEYFNDWPEYVNYLAEHLVASPDNARKILTGYNGARKRFISKVGAWKEGADYLEAEIGRAVASSIVCEDFELSKLVNRGISIIKYISDHRNEIKRANKK